MRSPAALACRRRAFRATVDAAARGSHLHMLVDPAAVATAIETSLHRLGCQA